MKVRELMSHPAVTVRPETRLAEVARILVDRRIGGLPVVDPSGTVLGVVSETDIVARESSGEWRSGRPEPEDLVAGTVMTRPPITIGPEEPIQVAAARMIDRQVNRLLVVDDGRLLGVISRADLVRAYIRTDDDLAATIRDEILHRILWLDPDLFSVTVTDGHVRIRGWVERRSTLELLDWATRLVPGVIDVEIDVTWSLDDSEGGGLTEPAMREQPTPNGRRRGSGTRTAT